MWYTMRYMATEIAPTRRGFLGLDKLDNLMESRRGRQRSQSHTRINQPQHPQPEPPRIDRGAFIVGGLAALGGLAIFRPWDWFRSAQPPPEPDLPQPRASSTPEVVLDQSIIEQAEREVFDLTTYDADKRQKMANFWRDGQTQIVEYTKPNGDKFLLSFQPAKPVREMEDLAKTTVSFYRHNFPDGRSSIVIYLEGQYLENLGVGMPPDIQRRLMDMNFAHEAMVSIASINALTNIAKSLGLDITSGKPKTPEEDTLVPKFQSYIPVAIAMGEAVAEVQDYILTDPLIDKDSETGQTFWATIGNKPPYMPLMRGKIFMEGGLHRLVDTTIGPSIQGFSDFDSLTARYRRLEEIPNYQEYYQRIKAHYSK